MLRFLLVMILLVLTFVLCDIELVVLHTNDMHGRFEETEKNSGTCKDRNRELSCVGGFPRLVHEVRTIRRSLAGVSGKEVLFLNAGDSYTGTAWFTLYKWNITVEFINALELDVMVSTLDIFFIFS